MAELIRQLSPVARNYYARDPSSSPIKSSFNDATVIYDKNVIVSGYNQLSIINPRTIMILKANGRGNEGIVNSDIQYEITDRKSKVKSVTIKPDIPLKYRGFTIDSSRSLSLPWGDRTLQLLYNKEVISNGRLTETFQYGGIVATDGKYEMVCSFNRSNPLTFFVEQFSHYRLVKFVFDSKQEIISINTGSFVIKYTGKRYYFTSILKRYYLTTDEITFLYENPEKLLLLNNQPIQLYPTLMGLIFPRFNKS